MKKSKMKKWAILLLCGVLLFGTVPAMSAVKASELKAELVYGDTFAAKTKIPEWTVTSGYATLVHSSDTVDSTKRHNRHLFVQSNDEQVSISRDKFAVAALTEYQLESQLRWESAPIENLLYGIQFYNSNDELLSSEPYVWSMAGGTTGQWLTISQSFTSVEGAASARLLIYTDDRESVSFLLDNLKLSELKENKVESVVFTEDFNKDMQVPGWRSLNAYLSVLTTLADGKQVMVFDDIYTVQSPQGELAANSAQLHIRSDKFDVEAGETYTMSAKVNAFLQTHQFNVRLYFYDKDNKVMANPPAISSAAGSLLNKGWMDIKLAEPYVAPEGAVKAEISFESGNVSRTKVYIDQVEVSKLVESTPEQPIEHPTALPNGNFEADLVAGQIPNWSIDPAAAGGAIALNRDIVLEGAQSLFFQDSSTTVGMRVISDPVAVNPSATVLLTTNVYVTQQTHNIVLEMNFYRQDGTKTGKTVQDLFSSNTLGQNKWSVMRLTGEAPADAAFAKVSLYSGNPSLTQAYFDNISVTERLPELPLDRQYEAATDLGDMVDVSLGQAGAIQTNAKGENEVYFVTNGKPGSFFVLDGDTGKLKFSQVIPNTIATWAMTIDQEKNVYFSGTEDGKLYKYDPVKQEIEDLGYNTTDNWVWDLEAIDDKIYGGTYNSKTDGKLFEYDRTTGTFRNYGVVEQGQQYVRGIAVDDQYIYTAMGATVRLYKVDRATGEKTEILIPEYSGTTATMGSVHVENGKIFAAVSTINVVVLDAESGEVDAAFQYDDQFSEPNPDNANIIYFKRAKSFYQYDMQSKQVSEIELDISLPDTLRVKDYAWITPESGAYKGKTVLAMLTQYGEYIYIDINNKTAAYVPLELELQPVNIQSLQTGFDGRLYLGGYQRGMSVYNPFTESIDVNLPTFAQPENIGFLNDKVYYGTYVAAIMQVYDPAKEAVMNENPKPVYQIKHQDRPFAITSGDNKLFVGTVPDYGYLGGSLAVFDEPSNTWKQYDHEQVVRNQSIIGLAYRDGLLFGSTTIWGGLGIEPSESEAMIFVWDVEEGKLLKQFKLSELDLQIDEAPKMIGSIAFGPDGLLWGVVDGTLFALDVADIDNITLEKQKMINPSKYNSSKWMPYVLQWAPDGLLYTTISRQLYAVDPNTLQYTLVHNGFVNSMTLGIDGTIYFAPEAGTKLAKIAVPQTDATLAELLINGEVLEKFSPGILSYEVDLKLLGEVTAAATQEDAEVVIDNTNQRHIIITVKAADEVSMLQYEVKFVESSEGPNPEPTPRPDSGSPDNGGSQPGTDKTVQIITPEQLEKNATIALQAGVETVQLPAKHTDEIVLENSDVSLQLSKQLLEKANQQAGTKHPILVAVKAADEAQTDAAEQHAAQKHSAKIEFQSKAIALDLTVNGIQQLSTEQGMVIRFPVQNDADARLTHIYKINEDGSLQYVPGTINGGVIQASINEAGTYVAATIDRTYEDVAAEHWAYDAIKELSAKLIANGVSEQVFAPNREITRAEFMTLLVRTLNLRAGEGGSVYFNDVAAQAWYNSYVGAAYEAGIVQGAGEGSFNPDAAITREEMAAMLLRAYRLTNGPIAVEPEASTFADEESISKWAKESVAAAQQLQLLNGRGQNLFAPQANLTRAEAVKSIEALLE